MTTIHRDALIDKIRKLRALASSPNVNEAATAARLAEKLLQEHAVAEAEIDAREGVDIPEPMIEADAVVFDGSKVATWHSALLQGLADAYQVACFLDARGPSKTLKAYGRPSDIETMRFQYAFFTSEIVRLANNPIYKGSGRTWRNSFCIGAMHAIVDALKDARREVRAQASGAALVKIDDRAKKADELMRSLNKNLRTSRSSYRVDPDGLAAGKRAGAGLAPKPAFGAGGARLLGTGS